MSSGAVMPVPIRQDVLDNLCSRFLINIPEEEKGDPIKLCYHIELAHWFYLDFMRPEETSLPACSFKEFIATVFRHVPSLAVRDLSILQLVEEYKASKQRRPVCGGIILNTQLDKCLLVQGYSSTNSWGFPKGKLEDGETAEEAAIREVYEEIGLDVRGMVRKDWVIERTLMGHSNRMYIIPNIPESTKFATRTRKEISKIEWFEIAGLPQHSKDQTPRTKLGKSPNNFYLVVQFVKPLRDWIDRQNSKLKTPPVGKHGRPGSPRSTGGKRRSSAAATQRSSSASKVGGRSTSLVAGGGSSGGQLAPAVQHLFALTQSPKSGAGGGALPSRGKTEPSTQMKHPQPKGDGGVSLGSSVPSHSLLHLLRQGTTEGQQQAPPSSATHPPAAGMQHMLQTAIQAYQAVPTVRDYSAQGAEHSLSHFTFQAPAWQNFTFDHSRIMQHFERVSVAQTTGK